MPIARKPKSTSPAFSPEQIASARTAAEPRLAPDGVDWAKGVVTPGGGVAATIGSLRRTRGKNKNPTKEQVAIRFDPEVLAAFRADGPGWQSRMNKALKEWLEQRGGGKASVATKERG